MYVSVVNYFWVQLIAHTGAVQAPAAAASSSSSSSAHVQHNVSAASTQPSVPPAPVPAPAAVPAAALVATTVPVQPIVSQPPLRKPRPPPREGEDRAIPIHLVPIRRVDMVPVLADHPPPAPVLAPVPAGTLGCWLAVVPSLQRT